MPLSNLANPDHNPLITKLQAVENEYLKGGTLSSESILYLIQQATWALRLDQAGQALNLAAAAYIEKLEGDNVALRERNSELGGKLAHETYGNKILRENINKLTDGKAFPTND